MKVLSFALVALGAFIVGLAGDRWACDLQLAASTAPARATVAQADRARAYDQGPTTPAPALEPATQVAATSSSAESQAAPAPAPRQTPVAASPPPAPTAPPPPAATPPPNPQTFLRVTVAGAPALQCYGTAQGFDCEDPRTYAMATFAAGERLPYTRLLTDVRGRQFYILGPWTPVGLLPAEDATPTT